MHQSTFGKRPNREAGGPEPCAVEPGSSFRLSMVSSPRLPLEKRTSTGMVSPRITRSNGIATSEWPLSSRFGTVPVNVSIPLARSSYASGGTIIGSIANSWVPAATLIPRGRAIVKAGIPEASATPEVELLWAWLNLASLSRIDIPPDRGDRHVSIRAGASMNPVICWSKPYSRDRKEAEIQELRSAKG
jgi:hypothetical protein